MGCQRLTYHQKTLWKTESTPIFEIGQKQGGDYQVFGVQLPGRSFNSDEYRRGFNGMEKDDEIKGSGNSYDFGARMYDPRLGRWLSVDPLAAKFPNMSPYAAFNNNPLRFVDPDGRAPQDWIKKKGSTQWEWDASVTSENNTPAGYDYAAPGFKYDYMSSDGPGEVTLGNGPRDWEFSLNQEVEPDVYASSPYDLNNNSTQQYDNMMGREINNFSQMRSFMEGSDGTLNEFNSRYDSKGMMEIARYTENAVSAAVMLSSGFALGGVALAARGISMGVDVASQATFKGWSEVNYAQTAGAGLGGFGGAGLGAAVDWRPFSSDPVGRRLDWAINKDQGWGEIGINFATGWASGKVGGIKANSYSGFDRAVTIGGSSFLGQGVSNGIIEGPLKQ